ncbi:MAG: hypothetical protein PHD13_01930 [Methanocellales archaeon]|nr:hypothetical protein [Methanocellales archaeon]MDD3291038.1 hypothetical protein [Methanocellales archaeon]MDD5234923.1 hypothetical protein [Methanocellales archaeon]MDD5484707.1 hypothetical protein [Methanocellales archaeon]
MARPAKKPEERELNAVYNAIEDYIFECHKLCSIKEISERSKLNKDRCKKVLNSLVKDKRVYEIYKSTNAVVYIPTYMVDEILRTQNKPRWVENYLFDEKKNNLEKIERFKEEIKPCEMFESLLYATSTPLEDAVTFALDWLEFNDVKHLKEDPDNHDIEFKYSGKLYLVEVKGKGKEGDKEDIQQLEGWVKKKIVNEDMKIDELEGLFVINHYRKIDPKERDDPLTPHAKQFLKLHNFKFITTPYLFNSIKKIRNSEMTKEEVQEDISKGEKYE